MDETLQPTPLVDPALQLQRDIYFQLVNTLREILPPPATVTPEAIALRDRVAIAQVAALAPAGADEANIGAHYVAAMARASECLRLIAQDAVDAERVLRLNAQASAMMRQACGFRSLLLRIQTDRRKREANDAAFGRDTMTEHCVLGLMTRALDPAAPPASADPPQPTVGAVPAAAPPPAQQHPDAQGAAGPEQRDLEAEAERYAIVYPRRARLIRHYGGLPRDYDFGPPDPALLRFIVNGTSPALRALDEPAVAAA